MENSYEKAKTQSVANSLNEKTIQNKAVALQDNRPASLLQRKANNTGLPENLKSGIENLSGHSMDDVKVHYNSDKPAQLNAHAYAQGTDIHIASGQEKHLPHEAWHVVQQKQGRVKPTLQMKGKVNVNDDKGLEKEADVMGAKALQTKSKSVGIKSEKNRNLNFNNSNPTHTKNDHPVVQCWLDPALLSNKGGDKRIKDLLQKALNYNSHRKGRTRTMRIDELNILQVAIMHWLDAYTVPDQNVSKNALWVKDLMNEVQLEHQNLVKVSIKNNDDIPPVANFNTLKAEEQKQVKTIWQQLVKGTGNVHITEEENYTNSDTKLAGSRTHEGFRFEVLAQFARLLETETGRNIVAHVNKDTKGQKPVTIKPGFAHPSEGAPASVFAAGPTISNNSEKLTPLPVPPNQMFKGQKDANKKRENYKKQFVELDLTKIADNKLKSTAIYNARKNNPKAKGLKIGDKYFLFGSGIGVNVTITRDIRDAEDHHTSRSVDENRNEIPTPNFITLGHELGHATHMLDGVSLDNSKVSDHLLPQVGVVGAEELNWSNMEEYGNIHSVENSIRKEYGLKERFGHINQSTVQWELLNKIINAFLPLCDLQPEDDRAAVNDLLGEAGNLTNAMKIPEARVAIKGAATSFITHMHTVFPQFLVSESNAVKTQLENFKTHVNSAHADVLAKAEANIAQSILLINQANTRIQAIPPPAPPQQGGFFSRLWPF